MDSSDSSVVIMKVEYNGATRRFTLREFSFQKLQTRIRDAFQLPSAAQVQLTYVDKDEDVIMLIGDEDLEDALVFQKLNPLRVKIESLKTSNGVETTFPIANGAKSEEIKDSVTKAEPVIASGETSTVPEEKAAAVNEGNPEANSTSGTLGPKTLHWANKKTSAGGATGEKNTGSDKEEREDGPQQIHHGIVCDGCQMSPLTGPRFKSAVRPNYDLCGNCYATTGAKENEYLKIESFFFRLGYPGYLRRMSRRHGQGMRGRPDRRPAANPDTANAEKQSGEKKSSGDTPNKIVHIGVKCDDCQQVPIEGPRFKSKLRFNYDLCQGCFEKSGSDESKYSRLTEPFMQRNYLQFGHLSHRGAPLCGRISFECPFAGARFWILNEMVPKPDVDQACAEGAQGKSPKEEGAAEGRPVGPTAVVVVPVVSNDGVDSGMKVETPARLENDLVEGDKSSPTSGIEKVVKEAAAVNNSSQAAVAEGDEEAAVAADDSFSTAGVEETVQTPVDNSNKTFGVEETVQLPAAEGDVSTLEGKLAKLAAMGFEDTKLNEELLQKNNFDLRKTLDDLCGAEEWDPILGELQEMGFYDEKLNRRLMIKNNGSVKRVVKELVQMDKAKTKA